MEEFCAEETTIEAAIDTVTLTKGKLG